MDNEKKVFWIWLSSVPDIGAKRFAYLLSIFKDPEAVWETSESELLKYAPNIGKNAIYSIIEQKKDENLKYAEKILHRDDISVITIIEDEYPNLLKNIYAPPPILYIKGKLPENNLSSIAIVGSRRATYYGKQIAERLAYELGQKGIVVVSGLARGIDAMAHQGALKAGGHTIGVLGCGVDIVYPQDNIKYYREIAEKGTLISEYPLGTTPIAGNFPARNRIISGLSQGVVVVEARQRSGALITVDFALEQGRDVFAVPGNINQPCSYGTNNLIKQGAKLVMSVEDILEELPDYIMHSRQEPESIQLDFLETQVYNALDSEAKHIDEIGNITGIGMGQLNSILTKLEIRGVIKRLPGKFFVKS
ncbi:MAG TPA: DNA-protecting protein DprA [Clostridiales bacterium]|nr:DNA-protecting protein DprA [Clostridiales bacterium]